MTHQILIEENLKTFRVRDCLYEGWEVLKKYPIEIFIGLIFYFLGALFTIGVLAGCLGAGYIEYILKLKNNREDTTPVPTEVFSKLGVVVPTFKICLLILVLNAINNFVIGGIFGNISLLTGLVMQSFVISLITLSIPLIGSGKVVDAQEAIDIAWRAFTLSPKNFLFLALLLIILGILGALTLGLGLVVTSPLSACIVAVAFEKLSTENNEVT